LGPLTRHAPPLRFVNMDVQQPHRPVLDLFLWLLVVVMAVVVVYTSVSPPGDGTLPLSDKLLHYLAYMGLTMSMLLAAVWAPVRGAGRFPSASLAIVIIAFLFGFGIEVVQGPLPDRDAELLDALANAAGAVTALILWTVWRVGTTSAPRA
jgi:VanZ family protein